MKGNEHHEKQPGSVELNLWKQLTGLLKTGISYGEFSSYMCSFSLELSISSKPQGDQDTPVPYISGLVKVMG